MQTARPHNEDLRQLEHLAPIVFAFLLRYLTWSQALLFAALAIAYAAFVSPKLLAATQRPDEAARGYSSGKLAYAVSVFLLILLFPDKEYIAATVWANLSVGDAASNFFGRKYGRSFLPWNSEKTWFGMFAAIFLSAPAGYALIAWTGIQSTPRPDHVLMLLYATTTAIVCSLVETIKLPIDDNITISIGGAVYLSWLSTATWPAGLAWAELALGLGISAAIGFIAFLLKTVTFDGFLWGVIIGSVVFFSFGVEGFLLLGTFFVLGSFFSRLGYRRKALLGTAEANQGRRSARHVLGKGFASLVAALAAVFLESRDLIELGFVAAVAAALYDTTATELGQLVSGHPVLLMSFKAVPCGTPGAVSLAGSTLGFVGGGLIVAEAYWFGLLNSAEVSWALLAAFLAVHVESYLTASSPGRPSGSLMNALHTTVSLLLAMLLSRVRL